MSIATIQERQRRQEMYPSFHAHRPLRYGIGLVLVTLAVIGGMMILPDIKRYIRISKM